MTWEDYLKLPSKDFPCPCCFADFDSRVEKDFHLQEEHEYMVLETYEPKN